MTELSRRGFIAAAGSASAAGLLLALNARGGTATAGTTEPAGTGTLAEARDRGSMRVAFINNKPLSYIDDESGKLDGSGPAVLGAILATLGIPELDPVFVEFDAVIPGLLAKRWDMSAFPFYITPPRCDQVAFTNPTARYVEGALVQAGNPKNLHSYPDLANPDVKVAIQTGNAEIDWAVGAGVAEDGIQLFPEEALAVEAVRQGRADVYLNATFAIIQALKNYGDDNLELAAPFEGPIIDGAEVIAYGGWALRSDDTSLREAFNAELAAMLASGQLLELQAPFGYDDESLPTDDVTAADLCPAATWG